MSSAISNTLSALIDQNELGIVSYDNLSQYVIPVTQKSPRRDPAWICFFSKTGEPSFSRSCYCRLGLRRCPSLYLGLSGQPRRGHQDWVEVRVDRPWGLREVSLCLSRVRTTPGARITHTRRPFPRGTLGQGVWQRRSSTSGVRVGVGQGQRSHPGHLTASEAATGATAAVAETDAWWKPGSLRDHPGQDSVLCRAVGRN